MAGSFLPVPDRPEDVRPAYFFCGEDLYEARGFVAELRRRLAGPGEAAGAGVQFLRRARGFTPLAMPLPASGPPVLAFGAIGVLLWVVPEAPPVTITTRSFRLG